MSDNDTSSAVDGAADDEWLAEAASLDSPELPPPPEEPEQPPSAGTTDLVLIRSWLTKVRIWTHRTLPELALAVLGLLALPALMLAIFLAVPDGGWSRESGNPFFSTPWAPLSLLTLLLLGAAQGILMCVTWADQNVLLLGWLRRRKTARLTEENVVIVDALLVWNDQYRRAAWFHARAGMTEQLGRQDEMNELLRGIRYHMALLPSGWRPQPLMVLLREQEEAKVAAAEMLRLQRGRGRRNGSPTLSGG